ncbi:hypothetical protein V0U79_10485 [Hyphobacterium sp. HN65]|uniref:XRE family transcriptional regulator n=1 Tax=Hyphobacterium lacteum TaxID=3116575 RepID=A0ABU7LSC6_9PROT|nr:hypothetical protein [Hyphobacterium sp. HN65]MEE2526798.1 hypothetical protein [Hyphobacterium sp. HN65]
MSALDRFRELPGERIASMIKLVVHHRGPEAELALIHAFGEARIKEIYGGDEPRFSELEEIASILAVPVSAFQVSAPGEFPELEIAWAEILYHANGLGRRDLEKLALELAKLTPNNGESILSLMRRQRNWRK